MNKLTVVIYSPITGEVQNEYQVHSTDVEALENLRDEFGDSMEIIGGNTNEILRF